LKLFGLVSTYLDQILSYPKSVERKEKSGKIIPVGIEENSCRYS
jgi:hypothetical protein